MDSPISTFRPLSEIAAPPPVDKFKGNAVVTGLKFAETQYGPSLQVDLAYPAESPDRRNLTDFIDLGFMTADYSMLDTQAKSRNTKNYNKYFGLVTALGVETESDPDVISAKGVGQAVAITTFPHYKDKSRLTVGTYAAKTVNN